MTSKATVATQTESDSLDIFSSDDSLDESSTSIPDLPLESHNQYFEDSYVGYAHSEDLCREPQLISDLDSGVLEITNAMEPRASSPLSDKTEQDLLAAYNSFSPTAASQSNDICQPRISV